MATTATTNKIAEAFKNQIREAIEFAKTLTPKDIAKAKYDLEKYRDDYEGQPQYYDDATGWGNVIASEVFHGDGSEYEAVFDGILESLSSDFPDEEGINDSSAEEFEALFCELRNTFPENTNPIEYISEERFSTNPKMRDWYPTEQQKKVILQAREILGVVPEDEGDDSNAFVINLLNGYASSNPDITDPKQLIHEYIDYHKSIAAKHQVIRDRLNDRNSSST